MANVRDVRPIHVLLHDNGDSKYLKYKKQSIYRNDDQSREFTTTLRV